MRNIPTQTIVPIGGMNKDSSPEVIKDGKYIHAENLVPTDTFADAAGIQGADYGHATRLSTAQSDSLVGTLPPIPTQGRYKCCFEVTTPGDPYLLDLTVGFLIDGTGPVTGTVFSLPSPQWVADLAAMINSDPVVGEWVFAAESCGCITIRPRSFRVKSLTVYSSGGFNITATITQDDIPGQPSHFPIGWGATNDYWVLFTTAPENHLPADTTPFNYGQVWVFKIDQAGGGIGIPTTDADLDECVAYHGELNFSRLHQMTSVEVVPESDCLLNVVFTDNYNPVRILNVLDQWKTRLLTPGQLRLAQPEAKLPPIVFMGQGNGSLPHGAFFYTYRLIGATNQRSIWAQPTIRINNLILNTDPSVNDYQYTRAFATGAPGGGGAGAYDVGSPTSNSNQLRIEDVDTTYSVAEVVCLYCETLDGPPTEAFIIGRYPINGPIVEFSHITMDRNFPDITVEEIVTEPIFANTVKALAQSQSRIVLGNICSGYSLPYTQKIGTQPSDIQVQFVRHRLLVDTLVGTPPPSWGSYLDYIKGHPLSLATNIPGDDYTTATLAGGSPSIRLNGNRQFLDHKGAYVEHMLRGYMSQEIYRFGIVFHLKSGQRTAPYWIGDVQIPLRSDGGATLNYPLSELGQFNTNSGPINVGYVNPIGIRFNGINVAAIRDSINGFSIVRSKAAGRVVMGGFLDARVGPSPAPNRQGLFYSPDDDSGEAQYFFQDGDYLSVTLHLELVNPLSISYYKHYINSEIIGLVSGTPLAEVKVFPETFQRTNGPIGGYWDYDGTSPGLGRWLIEPSALSIPEWDELVEFIPTAILYGRSFYAQVIRPVVPFGGDDAKALEATEWYYTGNYVRVGECFSGGGEYVYGPVVYGGDTFCDLYSRIETVTFQDRAVFATQQVGAERIAPGIFPTESRCNPTLRSIQDEATQTFAEIHVASPTAPNPPYENKMETHANRSVFWRGGIVPLVGESSVATKCEICFPYSIIPTARRLVGEDYNVWQNVLINDQVQLDARFGEVNKIAAETDGSAVVVAWQENAVSIIPVGSQRLSSDGATIELVAGSGTVIGTPRYKSFLYGTQHIHSVVRTPAGFMWVDAARRAHVALGTDGVAAISEFGDMRSWFERAVPPVGYIDNPALLGGLHSTYDFKNNLLLLTLKYNSEALGQYGKQPENGVSEWTLMYSPARKNYPGFYTPKPFMFFSLPGNRLLSFDPTLSVPNPINPENPNDLYRHFSESVGHLLFYGAAPIPPATPSTLYITPTPAKIVLAVNESPQVTKALQSFIAMQNKVWSKCEVATNEQNQQPPASPMLSNIHTGRYRGARSMGDARPRGGKWLFPAPPMLERYTESAGWLPLDRWQPVARGEYFFVALECAFVDRRDLAALAAVFAPIANNT